MFFERSQPNIFTMVAFKRCSAVCAGGNSALLCSLRMGASILSNCSKINFNLDFGAARLRDFEMSRILAASMPRFQYAKKRKKRKQVII